MQHRFSKQLKKKLFSPVPFPKPNTALFLFSFCLIILLLPLTIFFLQKEQNTNSQATAAGNALYVSPSGNDANNGSQSSPLATIQKAADMATAGTTVHVLPGTYTQIVTNNQSGTAGAPITFISDRKWGAKIVTGGGLRNFPFRNNGSYVTIDGFDITSSTSWLGILSYGQHNIIQHNHVHNLTGMSCTGSPGGEGIGDDVSASNNVFNGNVVNNIGSYPTKCDYVHGIYVDGNADIIENNIAYNNAGNGLYTNHGSGRVTFVNNLSFANAEYGIGVNGSLNGSTVENNIVVGNGIAGIKTWSTVANTQFLSNILFNNPATFVLDGGGTQQNTITSDPQFINYQANGSGDYHVKAGSPAIDGGVSTNAPGTDIDGTPRPQGRAFDIGPYENGGSPISPTIQPSVIQPTAVQPTNTLVPTYVCEGPASCAGTPSPTVFGGVTPSPSASVPSISPNPSVGISPAPSISVKPSPISGRGGEGNILNLLLKLLEEIIKLLQHLLLNGSSMHIHEAK